MVQARDDSRLGALELQTQSDTRAQAHGKPGTLNKPQAFRHAWVGMGWHELARLTCLRQIIAHMRGLCFQKESGRANRTLWELGRAVPGAIPVAHGCATLSDRSQSAEPSRESRDTS
jgi:hypothetical protein